MEGSEGCGGLSTGNHHYQKWVSLPQKGRDVDGGHFSSRDMAINRSGLSKKESFYASGEDAVADPAVDDDVTDQVTRLCLTLKSVSVDPASINSMADADDGASGAAVSGEMLVLDPDSCKGGYESKYGSGSMGKQISGSKSDTPEELQTSDGHHLGSGPSGYEHGEPAGRIRNGGNEDRLSRSCIGGSISASEIFILDDDVQNDTAAAGRVIPTSNGERSKVSLPTVRKTKTAFVAGSGVIKKLPSREWVKTRRDENGSHPCVSNLTQLPAPVDKISILGLGDKDFPPIRPVSDSGSSRVASKLECDDTTSVKEVGYDSNNGRSLGTIASALQVDAPLSQSMVGALQVDAPLTQSMAGAIQVEAPLN